MTFAAPYDRTTKAISGVVVVLMIAPALLVPSPFVRAAIAGLLFLTLAVAYAYSPRAYSIADGIITVKRLISDVQIPLSDVQEARRAQPEDFTGCIRLFGSGGLFGYYGLFRTSKLGRCTWYITDRSRAVVIKTSSKTVLFSPDNVDGFLAAIGPFTSSAAAPALSVPGSRFPVAIVLVLVVALAPLALIPIAFSYNPGAPPYTLSPGSLLIKDRFYPVTIGAASTDIQHIRVVDFDDEPGWLPAARVGGFANGHYQSGWFRAANGTRMRMYRSRDDRRVVLLPPKGRDAPVLLQVADPDQFVEHLRREWN